MRYAIIADIHANLAAFDAVLDDTKQRKVNELWCLGDVVGYGPEPHECIELLRRFKFICVAGNHDWGAVGKLDIFEFNSDAATACRWTAQVLSAEDKAFLEKLPLIVEKEDFTLVHGSPRDPLREYVISLERAQENLTRFATQFCLVGHSHVPLVYRHGKSGDVSFSQIASDSILPLGESRLIINPGSVGQPRDGDPRASYAIYDGETRQVESYRVSYNIALTQKKMMAYNLPLRLAARLSYGT